VKVVYATATGPVNLPNGGRGNVRHGTHWPADDPVVLANPTMFSDDPRYGLAFSEQPEGYDAPVEQATAAPGEKRQTRRG
jgi:hypothetical protein